MDSSAVTALPLTWEGSAVGGAVAACLGFFNGCGFGSCFEDLAPTAIIISPQPYFR